MHLSLMTQEEFEPWLARSIEEYAGEKVKNGAWQPEDALERSRQEHSQLLPDGLASKDQYLYTLHDEATGQKVGVLWFAVVHWVGRRSAFVYDIAVDEPQRHKGYGTQAMRALEDKVRALGLDTIGLHVFGHNTIARDLYLKLGYEIADYEMVKKLGEK